MLREIVLLALGAIFGLGATMTAAVAPTYLPNMPPWAVHWLFWGGIALMAIMTVDAGCLILWRPRSMTALFLDLGLFFLAAAAISQFSPYSLPPKTTGTAQWRQTPTSFYEVLGNPIKNENWSSLLTIADEARRANEDTPFGLSLSQKPFNDILSAYAAKINDSIQLYGTRPGPVESEPIKEHGDQIIFRVNGMQMDFVSPNGHQLYRYIHLHTADVPETLEAVHKMAMEFSAKKSEALPAAVNFAYVSTLASGDDPFADHWAFVHNHKAVSILHLNISLKNTDDPATDYHFISPILYQEGAPFIPRGAPNTLRLGAGKYAATIQSQDGSFFEILELKKSMTGLKREIRVYKLSHSDQGRAQNPLLHIKDA